VHSQAESVTDPRVKYNGPFGNIHPDVHYVGDEQCNACHEDKARTYRQHPMGRSLVPIAEHASGQPYDKKHNNPFRALGSRFRVEREGNRIRHLRALLDAEGEPILEYGPEVNFALGSGTRGYSYVTDEDGYLFQTAISWYSQKQIWDLSPGFDQHQVTQRAITNDCLFCHANRTNPVPHYENRYTRPIFVGHAIGCERCHGPGERHIESTAALDIVNPNRKRLPDPRLRDAVCAQCHLQGLERVLRRGRELYDFRPGLPLEEFWAVFVLAEEGSPDSKAISHFEQMHLSRCFRNSLEEKKLGCISCHDPHVKPPLQERVAYYRMRCLDCHQEASCTLPHAERLRKNEDSCIDCHMPRFSAADVAHTAATDHRILRKPDGSVPAGTGPPRVSGSPPLALFGQERTGPRDRETARDLAVALVRAASHGQLSPYQTGAQALVLLGPALNDHPDDLEAWIARGWALMLTGDSLGGVAAFDEVLRRVPEHERALVGAATLAESVLNPNAALAYWRKAVGMNPWMGAYRQKLALLCSQQQLWEEGRRECQAWLRLEPDRIQARMLWIRYLLHDGKKDDARAEFTRIEALRPADLERWRMIYQEELKRSSR
jgi:tetratricopeptide (TPR) repeat protein